MNGIALADGSGTRLFSTSNYLPSFKRLLGDGFDYGCKFECAFHDTFGMLTIVTNSLEKVKTFGIGCVLKLMQEL